MKLLGAILVVLGIVAFLYGGITYKREKKVLDLGPIEATATEHKTIPLPPIVGAVALLGGVILLAAPARRA